MTDFITAIGVIVLVLLITSGLIRLKTRAMIGQPIADNDWFANLPSERPSLLFFYAPGCSVCRQMEPAIGELEQEGYTIRRINIAENTGMAGNFKVMAAPTTIIIKKQLISAYHVGFRNKLKLLNELID